MTRPIDFTIEVTYMADGNGWGGIAHLDGRELCRTADPEPCPYAVFAAMIEGAKFELGLHSSLVIDEKRHSTNVVTLYPKRPRLTGWGRR